MSTHVNNVLLIAYWFTLNNIARINLYDVYPLFVYRFLSRLGKKKIDVQSKGMKMVYYRVNCLVI